MNTESIEIILEIARLKKKLVKTIVPEKTMEHLEVIGREVKEMIIESLVDSKAKAKDNKSKTGINKVTIE